MSKFIVPAGQAEEYPLAAVLITWPVVVPAGLSAHVIVDDDQDSVIRRTAVPVPSVQEEDQFEYSARLVSMTWVPA